MRKELIVIDTLEVNKEDFSNLEGYLKKNNLLDDNNIWFAGFDDQRRGSQNAVAANLFYGNAKLMVVTINEDTVYYLQNTKGGFQVVKLGTVDEKFKTILRRGFVYPSIEIHGPRDQYLEIKITKNKGIIKTFRSKIK